MKIKNSADFDFKLVLNSYHTEGFDKTSFKLQESINKSTAILHAIAVINFGDFIDKFHIDNNITDFTIEFIPYFSDLPNLDFTITIFDKNDKVIPQYTVTDELTNEKQLNNIYEVLHEEVNRLCSNIYNFKYLGLVKEEVPTSFKFDKNIKEKIYSYFLNNKINIAVNRYIIERSLKKNVLVTEDTFIKI